MWLWLQLRRMQGKMLRQVHKRKVKEEFMDITVIGKQIARGRHEVGLSQAKFADLLSVTPQAVGKWERSESLPDIFMLGKIGEIIGTHDICYFLGKERCTCTCGCCDCCKN
jgi:DNA-binding XRE family transcriptional regulator